MRLLKSTSLLGAAVIFSAIIGCTNAGADSNKMSKAEVEKIVKEYLLENPEIIREAMIILDEREERAQIVAVKDELHNDKRDYAYGPKNAKVKIVEFFDYNCPYCKQSTAWLQNVMEKHPKDVRVIFKELPILDRRTQTSRNAAKAALAAGRQGKYNEMHLEMMNGKNLSEKYIDASAKKIGLDMKKFKKDIADPAFDEQLEDGMFLASRIPGLTGTPFFIVNEKFIASGNTQALNEMLKEALAE